MDFNEIYATSFRNRLSLKESKKCGCFSCGNIFDASKVKEYESETDNRDKDTGICPICKNPTLIPDSKVKLDPKVLDILNDTFN